MLVLVKILKSILSRREIIKQSERHILFFSEVGWFVCLKPVIDPGAVGCVTTKLPLFSVRVSVYQVFLKLRTPALYFFKPHDVSRLRTGMCHEEAALFWCVSVP